MMRSVLSAVMLGGLVASAGAVQAASIAAVALDDSLRVGQTTTIDIYLNLDVDEHASVFEGRFDLSGIGSVIDVTDMQAGGASWDSAFGNMDDNQVFLSLISGNLSGNRLLASLTVLALAAGSVEIYLGASMAAFDLPGPPYLRNLPIATPPGELLASITVSAVPLPPALPLLACALAALGFAGYGRRG